MELTKTNLPPVTEFIESGEGCKLKPYKDTKGILTIGVGRNLQDVGLRPNEVEYFKQKYGLTDEDAVWAHLNIGIDRKDALFLLAGDIEVAKVNIKKIVPYFSQLPSFIQYVMLDMVFNMGIGNSKKGLNSFKGMIGAIGSYHVQGNPDNLDVAAVELLDSSYLVDVKTRAVRNAKLMCNDFSKVKKILGSRPGKQEKLNLVLKYGG